jgi:hypothetical protein
VYWTNHTKETKATMRRMFREQDCDNVRRELSSSPSSTKLKILANE